jgi:hypothetical protein
MTNGRVEVITYVERRRRWRLSEKERIVPASLLIMRRADEVQSGVRLKLIRKMQVYALVGTPLVGALFGVRRKGDHKEAM